MATIDSSLVSHRATRGDGPGSAEDATLQQRCGLLGGKRIRLQTPVPPNPPEVPPIPPSPPIEPPDPVSPPMEPPVPDMPPIGDPPRGPEQPTAASRAAMPMQRASARLRRGASLRNR